MNFSDKIERTAKRLTLRLIRYAYDRGVGPNAIPPPLHCGERIEP